MHTSASFDQQRDSSRRMEMMNQEISIVKKKEKKISIVDRQLLISAILFFLK